MYDKNEFEKEVMPNGKVIYKHIKNGQKRVEILEKLKNKEISIQDFRHMQRTKYFSIELPYLFSEQEFYDLTY